MADEDDYFLRIRVRSRLVWKHPNLRNDDNGNHEEEISRTNESGLPKSKIRRTRLKTLFEEFQVIFQKEVSGLEENIEELAAENSRLKSTNENLRQRLDEDETKGNSKDAESAGEISAIIKLSNKLQEMIQANEDITRVNAALRRDLKGLQNEREGHLKDIAKLREENKMARIPYSYSKYSESDMLKDKSFDRNKRRTPIKPSDSYNSEDLNQEFEKFANNYNSNNSSSSQLLTDENSIKDYSYETMAAAGRTCSPSYYQSERLKKVISPVVNNSATEALQKLVSKVDQTHSGDSPIMSNKGSLTPPSDRNTPKNISNHMKSSSPKLDSSVETDDVISPRNKENGVRYSDPIRYPACVKLLELTKARIGDEIMNQSSRLSPPHNEAAEKSYETAAAMTSTESAYWNNGMASIGSNGGPVVHHHASADNMSEHDRASHKGVGVEDDITIVLPSSDHSLSRPLSTGSVDNIHPRDAHYRSPNHPAAAENIHHGGRDMMYSNSPNNDTRSRSHMEQMYNSTSVMENQRSSPPDMNSLEVVVSSSSEYMYNYSSTTYNHRYPPPMKRIKVEDVFK